MPRAREDLFIDNVQEYGRWISQPIFWPHVVGPSRRDDACLEVEQQRITEMTPQHAVSALQKSIRWYEWLESNGRFIQAGRGMDKTPERRYAHHASPLVRALMIQAITAPVWNAQFNERAHGGRGGLIEETPEVIPDRDFLLEVAIDASAEWERLQQTQPVKVSPARRALALRDILTRTIIEKEGPT